MRTCKKCLVEKEDEHFGYHGKYRRTRCRRCRQEGKSQARSRLTPEERLVKTRKWNAKVKVNRRSREYRTQFAMGGARRRDRAAGRVTTLTNDEAHQLLNAACIYCGDTELMMTLDRVDNSRGYEPGNVVGCCIRCNYTRRDMPMAAWLVIADAMRSARLLGAFGAWVGRARS